MTASAPAGSPAPAVDSAFDSALDRPTAMTRINTIVSELFRAGLALDAVQQSAASEYARARSAVAAAALDQALCELRVLATELDDRGVR